MLVQVLVVLMLLVSADDVGPFARGAEIGLPSCFRTYGAQRDQLLQIFLIARGALRGGSRRENQVLKTMSAAPALVFIDRHERSLSPLVSRWQHDDSGRSGAEGIYGRFSTYESHRRCLPVCRRSARTKDRYAIRSSRGFLAIQDLRDPPGPAEQQEPSAQRRTGAQAHRRRHREVS